MSVLLGWVIQLILIPGAVYFGFYVGHEGAQNLLVFMYWVICLMSISLSILLFISPDNEDVSRSILNKERFGVPKLIGRSIVCIVAAIMIWFGYIATPIIMALGLISSEISRGIAENTLEKSDAKTEGN